MTMRLILEALRDGRLSAAEAKARLVALGDGQPPAPPAPVRPGDIAIISMAGRFPGAADTEAFWNNLCDGTDNITEIPPARWRADDYYSAEKGAPGKSYCRWGGFIDDVDRFDPAFFKISPREAQLMDPQERLLLQTVWSLFERIGYTRPYLSEAFDGNVCVFTGAMYQQYHAFDTDLEKKASIAVSSLASMANRISHFFDFTGASLAVDTMCSSAATAIHLACESLRAGSCRLAVVGATNLSIHPFKYIALSQAQLLASDPKTRALGQTDGFLPGETVGALLLKPLSQTIEDGDDVAAVIKGTAVSHKGYSAGFSVPNAGALQALMERNFADSGIPPSSIDYIETSASGAALGDAAEFQAIRAVYGARGPGLPQCRVGSVKGNIGHAEAATGIAQVIKVACQLRDKMLAPTIRIDPINPSLCADEPPFKAQRRLEPWEHPSGSRTQAPADPRRAAVHNFAAGGSNAHILLEEFTHSRPQASVVRIPETGPWLLPLSAATPDRLLAVVEALRSHLAGSTHDVGDLMFTLWHGREAMACRIAWVIDDATELDRSLEAAAKFLRRPQPGPLPAGMHHAWLDEIVPAPEAAGMRSREALDALAAQWVKGEATLARPNSLPRDQRARRMLALPTYPFARTICWVPPGSQYPDAVIEEARAPETMPIESVSGGVETLVRTQIALLTQFDPIELQLGAPLIDYGLNSMMMMALATSLCQAIGSEDEGADGGRLIQCRTAAELVGAIESIATVPARVEQANRPADAEIKGDAATPPLGDRPARRYPADARRRRKS